MTNRMMRDSGVEWIGDIPEEWENGKLRYLVNIKTGKKDVNQGNPSGQYPFFTCSMYPYKSNEYSFDCEALLVAGNGLVGFTQYFDGKFEAYQRTYVLSNFDHVFPHYLKHYIMELLPKYLSTKAIGSVIDFIKLGDLKSFDVTLPLIEEQQKIAAFLDEKVSHIDSIIKDTKESIENLKAYKQSLITETVTKGLDPNVEMKDSGIEWIGEIPSHWKVNKLKRVFNIKKSIANQLGYDILSVTQKGLKIKDISNNEGQLSADYSKYQTVEENDFVMNHMDLLTGWVDLSKFKGVTSPDYRVFRSSKPNIIENLFYKYVFQLAYSNRIFYGLGQGVSNKGRWRLPTDNFLNFEIPIPPIEEQHKIAFFLNEKISQNDLLIEQKEQLITELKEYKKSFIYEYVTGKKEVK